MQGILAQATSVGEKIFELDYTIGTLVNKKQEYEEMINSFVEAGFSPSSCEFLYIDNSTQNQLDAYQGLNRILGQARGKFIILCHQDILLNFDKKKELELRIKELDAKDSRWAVAGNAGAAGLNYIAYHITYPGGSTLFKGQFPLKAQSLDENFLLLKNCCGLSFSADLFGFHLYGTDICLQAEAKGYHCYVIDFHLFHKSRGNPDVQFAKLRRQLMKKYNKSFRSRWIQTPSTKFYLSGSLCGRMGGNPLFRFLLRQYNGIKKRMANGR